MSKDPVIAARKFNFGEKRGEIMRNIGEVGEYSTNKFCVHCKHYIGIPGDFSGRKSKHLCSKPALVNKVTGEPTDAGHNRNHPSLCGPEARYYDPSDSAVTKAPDK